MPSAASRVSRTLDAGMPVDAALADAALVDAPPDMDAASAAVVSVALDSDPAGAEVVVDGATIGRTPFRGELPAATRSVRAQLEFLGEPSD